MASNVPDSLKVIQAFLKLAKEYENRDPVVAYWSRFHAVQVGIKNKTKENVSFLMNLMDVLEKTKQKHSQEEAVTNDIVAQAHLENKGMQLFLWADNEDRAARFNKNVVKSFYSASLIFDILTVFGDLNDEILAQRKYAKWKAAYINNCLKKGEMPVPGPAGGGDQEFSNTAGPAAGLPYPAQPSSNMPNLPPSVVHPPDATNAATSYPPRVLPPSEPHAGVNPSPMQYPVQPQPEQPAVLASSGPSNTPETSGVHLDPTDFTKAQKYCKYAASALQYEDVPTAIDNLKKALKLLQAGEG